MEVEYLKQCPNCGMPIDKEFSRFCNFCGSSLIKTDIKTNGQNVNEMLNRMDDKTCPRRMVDGFVAVSDNNMSSVLFGSVFILAGIGFWIMVILAEMTQIAEEGILTVLKTGVMITLFSAIFVGAGYFVGPHTLVKKMLKKRKFKNGYDKRYLGVVRSYEDDTSVRINGAFNKFVHVQIHDPEPLLLIIHTHSPRRTFAVDEEVEVKQVGDLYMIDRKRD